MNQWMNIYSSTTDIHCLLNFAEVHFVPQGRAAQNRNRPARLARLLPPPDVHSRPRRLRHLLRARSSDPAAVRPSRWSGGEQGGAAMCAQRADWARPRPSHPRRCPARRTSGRPESVQVQREEKGPRPFPPAANRRWAATSTGKCMLLLPLLFCRFQKWKGSLCKVMLTCIVSSRCMHKERKKKTGTHK